MTVQQIIEQLKNIREQAVNDDENTKESMVEAITDVIHDASGDGGEWDFVSDDYDTLEETDFTKLEIL